MLFRIRDIQRQQTLCIERLGKVSGVTAQAKRNELRDMEFDK